MSKKKSKVVNLVPEPQVLMTKEAPKQVTPEDILVGLLDGPEVLGSICVVTKTKAGVTSVSWVGQDDTLNTAAMVLQAMAVKKINEEMK